MAARSPDPMTKSPDEGGSRPRTKGQAIEEAQAIVARHVPKGRDLVAELIAERREEAGRE